MTRAEKVGSCIGWNGDDRARLAEVHQWLAAERDTIVEDLGERLATFNGMRGLMTNARFMERLHGVLREWLMGLFEGASPGDRRELGHALARVDLGFEDVILLEGLMRERVFDLARTRLRGEPDRLSGVMHTLDKALNRDLALIHAGYLDVRDAKMEQALLDRFLTITGFSPTLYDSLARAWRWQEQEAD